MKPLKLSNVVSAAVPIGGEAPALRRVRVDPFEVLEVGGILELAERRQPMAGLGGGSRRAQDHGGQQQGRLEDRHEPRFHGRAHVRISWARADLAAALAPHIAEPLGGRVVVPPHPQERAAVCDGSLSGGRTCPTSPTRSKGIVPLRHDVVSSTAAPCRARAWQPPDRRDPWRG